MMNPDEYHDEPTWRSSRMQQHSEVENVHPYFQAKVSGAHDKWHNIIGHPPTAIVAQ